MKKLVCAVSALLVAAASPLFAEGAKVQISGSIGIILNGGWHCPPDTPPAPQPKPPAPRPEPVPPRPHHGEHAPRPQPAPAPAHHAPEETEVCGRVTGVNEIEGTVTIRCRGGSFTIKATARTKIVLEQRVEYLCHSTKRVYKQIGLDGLRAGDYVEAKLASTGPYGSYVSYIAVR